MSNSLNHFDIFVVIPLHSRIQIIFCEDPGKALIGKRQVELTTDKINYLKRARYHGHFKDSVFVLPRWVGQGDDYLRRVNTSHTKHKNHGLIWHGNFRSLQLIWGSPLTSVALLDLTLRQVLTCREPEMKFDLEGLKRISLNRYDNVILNDITWVINRPTQQPGKNLAVRVSRRTQELTSNRDILA